MYILAKYLDSLDDCCPGGLCGRRGNGLLQNRVEDDPLHRRVGRSLLPEHPITSRLTGQMKCLND